MWLHHTVKFLDDWQGRGQYRHAVFDLRTIRQEKHLSCAFGDEDSKAQELTKYFINKTFPIVYRVAPPVITDYQNIFDAHIAPAECPICSFVEFSYRDLSLFLKKEMKITHEEVLSEIKKVNGRRKKITDQEYCEYCLVKARKTSIEMFKEIKTQFNNYCAFNHYIKNQ